MNIRRFAPADADAVVRVSELATRITSGKVYDQTFVEEMVENQTRAYFLRRGEQMHFYVACEDDGTVIGCAAIGRPYRDDPAESCLYSVFVLPEKQNRGVGRALIEAIERDPWFLTARRVIIPASINALHFYQGLGPFFADQRGVAAGDHVAVSVNDADDAVGGLLHLDDHTLKNATGHSTPSLILGTACS